MQGSKIVLNEFELQLGCYVHFRTNTLSYTKNATPRTSILLVVIISAYTSVNATRIDGMRCEQTDEILHTWKPGAVRLLGDFHMASIAWHKYWPPLLQGFNYGPFFFFCCHETSSGGFS